MQLERNETYNQLRRSSFAHATLNTVSAILGISFLSTPYALEQGGWLGLGILLMFAAICCYTAFILGKCMRSPKGDNDSYNTIAEVAFGQRARIPFTLLMHFELVTVLVGYTISMGDNLAKLFPHVILKLGMLEIGPSKVLLLIAFVIILPTVWLRDLKYVSYLSLGGIITYLIITVTIAYASFAEVDGLGFHHRRVPLVNPINLLNVSGLYAYCFIAHGAFPSVYSSLRHPSNYALVMLVSFLITVPIYIGFGFLGGITFGTTVSSQISLSLPNHLTVAKVVLWLVVLLPLSKYTLCIAPMALDIETRFPWAVSSYSFRLASILLRSGFLILVFAFAMVLPYFETIVAFAGSASGMLIGVIMPSLFYLRLFNAKLKRWEFILNYSILAVGILAGVGGSIAAIIHHLHNK